MSDWKTNLLAYVLAPTPPWSKDLIYTEIDLHLGPRDLLLLLWRRGRMGVTVKTWTESPVGKTESISRILIRRIEWPWERRPFAIMDAGTARGGGYQDSDSEEES